MTILRNLFIGLLAVAILAFIGFKVFQVQIAERVFHNALERNMGTNVLDDLEDGLHVGICGAGSPMADPLRAGPCTFVIAGDRFFVFDAGDGAAKNIMMMGFNLTDIEAVMLTHYHSDHIDGLGNMGLLHWTMGPSYEPLPVWGRLTAKGGVDDIVDGFNAAYMHDRGYRIAHHSPQFMPPSGYGLTSVNFDIPNNGSMVLIDEGEMKITAFHVSHSPVEGAVGYRIDYKGRSVVISGDTKEDPNIEKFSNGVDMLVHEVLNKELVQKIEHMARDKNLKHSEKIMFDIQDYHTDPVEAAAIAERAGVKTLVFTHIVPAMPSKMLDKLYLKGVSDVYKGDVHLSQDMDFYSMPVNREEIKKTNMNSFR